MKGSAKGVTVYACDAACGATAGTCREWIVLREGERVSHFCSRACALAEVVRRFDRPRRGRGA